MGVKEVYRFWRQTPELSSGGRQSNLQNIKLERALLAAEGVQKGCYINKAAMDMVPIPAEI